MSMAEWSSRFTGRDIVAEEELENTILPPATEPHTYIHRWSTLILIYITYTYIHRYIHEYRSILSSRPSALSTVDTATVTLPPITPPAQVTLVVRRRFTGKSFKTFIHTYIHIPNQWW